MGTGLKWSEGSKMWAINEMDECCMAMRELSLPLGAGPSGTTNALMHTAAMIGGVSPEQARVACLGYLLPIHAHSAVEIMAGAAAHGAPLVADQEMYHHIAPFPEETLRMRYGIQPLNASGKPRFPDEAPATNAS